MKKLRWQILIVVVTLAIVGVLLLTQQPITTPAFIEPASGGIYTEALVGSFGRLNPLFDLNNQADREIDRLIFSSLIRFNERGIPQAELAESWGVSADGMIYNFTLRPSATWHDGTPVTSDDVIFTLSLVRSQFSAFSDDIRAMWDMVEITRLDDRNLKFTLPEPFAPFLDYLTFGILPRHLLESVPADQIIATDFNLAPVGSGPYRFEELTTSGGNITGVVLTRWDNYYGEKPFIDQIVFRYYDDEGDAFAAYQEGEVLGISRIDAGTLQAVLVEQNLALYSSRLPRLTLVLFNLNDPEKEFLQEKVIRRALMMALNRQWMVDAALQGQGIVADSPILPGTWAAYDGVEHLGYNPAEAARLLDEAGYLVGAGTSRGNDETTLALTLLHPDTEFHGQLAQSIQAYWTAIGIQVELQAVSYESLLTERLVTHDFEAVLVDLDMSRSYDPDPYPFWHQTEATGGQNYSQWDNRTASEYLEQARVIADMETRMRLYRNFQVIFARELPALPLFYPVYTFAIDLRVPGVQTAPLFEPADRFNNQASWYLVTRRALEETLLPSDLP